MDTSEQKGTLVHFNDRLSLGIVIVIFLRVLSVQFPAASLQIELLGLWKIYISASPSLFVTLLFK